MDLKALIAKMDQIEAKQILNESSGMSHMAHDTEIDIDDVDQAEPIKQQPAVDAKGRTREEWLKLVTTKFPTAKIMHAKTPNGPIIALLGDGRRVMWRKAEQGMPTEGFTSSIANALLVEFGLTEAGEWTPTPEQEKWLGGANRQDPFIINRMPGAKPPSSYFTDPADQAKAKQMGFDKPAAGAATKPAAPAAPTGTTAQGDDEGNTTITKPDGTTQVVGPDGNAIKPGSNPNLPQNKPTASGKPSIPAAGAPAAGAATKPAAPAAPAAAQPGGSQVQTDDDGNHMITTPDGKSIVVGPDGKPLPNGGKADPAAPATAAAPASGAATKPAAKPTGTPDPKVMAMQQELIKKGAKIQADGIMGPQTQAAQKQFGAPGTDLTGRKDASTDPRVAGNQTIDPAKLKRFKELLAKTGGGAATKPAAPAAAPAPAGQISDTPAA